MELCHRMQARLNFFEIRFEKDLQSGKDVVYFWKSATTKPKGANHGLYQPAQHVRHH